MNITYITNARLPTEKAHGLQIMKMCEAFADAGALVTLLVPRLPTFSDDPFAYYGVKRNFALKKIATLAVSNYYVRGLSFSLHAIIRTCWTDTIFYSRDMITLFLMALLGRRPVAEIHDYRSPKPQWQYRFFLRRCRVIIVNSEGTRSLLITHYSCIIPILVAPNGVDPKYFDIPETKEQAREKLGYPHDKTIVAYVGTRGIAGVVLKGVGALEEAGTMLKDRNDIEIKIVTGKLYLEVPLYLRAADILVLPKPEGIHAMTTSPIKLFEYMAAGKAIVRAQTYDPEELRKKILALVQHPEEMKRQGVASRQESFNHTWIARARAILDLLA